MDWDVVAKAHACSCPRSHLQWHKRRGASLALPTWTYGFEPTTPFATQIGKYFQNSITEDGLVSVGISGIVFVEGKAGMLQEIFQDASQNYYKSIKYRFSPMVFLGAEYWREKLPAYAPAREAVRRPKKAESQD